MRWNPDTKDGDIDGSDDNDGTPFDVADGVAMFSNERDSIDDDLHEQLDLEDPEKEDEEQNRNTVLLLVRPNTCV